MQTKFKSWIFSKLPSFFHSSDSYKVNGKGLLERFLESLGEELDEEVVDKLEEFLRILDPIATDSKFLNHIAYSLGNPPDFNSDEDTYRKLLRYIIPIYQIKGTRKSFVLLFNLLGFNATLILVYFTEDVIYDQDNIQLYDEDKPKQYDTLCESCVEYSVFISPLEADCRNPQDTDLSTISPGDLAIYKRLTCFLEPINAKLMAIYPAIPICEDIELSFREEVTITLEKPINYDKGYEYDSDEPESYGGDFNNDFNNDFLIE